MGKIKILKTNVWKFKVYLEKYVCKEREEWIILWKYLVELLKYKEQLGKKYQNKLKKNSNILIQN